MFPFYFYIESDKKAGSVTLRLSLMFPLSQGSLAEQGVSRGAIGNKVASGFLTKEQWA